MRFALPLAALTMLAACGAANGEKGDDSGPSVTRSFDVTGFDAVILAASDNVRVVNGAAFSVKATGPSEVLDRISIDVEGSKLKIGRKRDKWMDWSRSRGTAEITVTLPVLRRAVVAGSGNMQVDATANDSFDGTVAGSGNLDVARAPAKRIDLTIAGSGNLRAQSAAADVADLTIAGAGNLSVEGTAKHAELSIAGSGDIDASGLTTETADASIAGSGDIRIRATVSAKASIVGSGDIEVMGTKNCSISKRGSGSVRCVGS